MAVTEQAELPRPKYAGEMLDVDSHEMVPLQFWPEMFGDAIADVMPHIGGVARLEGDNSMDRPDIVSDAMEIDEHTVWYEKGPSAPGAIDMTRREAVMDVQGVAKQLVFPSFGLIGFNLLCNPLASQMFGFDPDEVDRMEIGRIIVRAHNAWVERTSKQLDADRVRLVGLIETTEIGQMMRDAEEMLAQGIQAVWIAGTVPPGGTSPGNTVLDPFWRLLADNNVAVVMHLGTELALLATNKWNDGVPQFAASHGSSLEFTIEPYRSATLNLTQTNFLSAMVLGGVFERHPNLRFGVIEVAAHWVGPLAEQLDMWFEEFHRRLSPVLSMRPSEYLNRNLRVTPFNFEPIDYYFERYPKLSDIYCYSSDFPHREGGKDSARKFEGKLRHLGEDINRKFFVENAKWLLPS